jgi:hypothetical protein
VLQLGLEMGKWRSVQGHEREKERQAKSKSAIDLLLALATDFKGKMAAGEQAAGRQDADKGAAGHSKRALHERAVAAAQHPAGFALLAGAAAYASVRGGIEVGANTGP